MKNKREKRKPLKDNYSGFKHDDAFAEKMEDLRRLLGLEEKSDVIRYSINNLHRKLLQNKKIVA